ncbi:MAG: carbohydrate ABC transporter permease [Lachnospiraceae bacterium]|nr:carbohydrate ABC transporter permease [Lachnospiraceae bacterium]
MKKKLNLGYWSPLKYLVLIFAAGLCLIPFIWVALSSVKEDGEIYSNSFGLPQVWVWKNYSDAWKGAQVALSFMNSIAYSFVAVGTLILISSMAAYILARVWKSQRMYNFFALGIMIPVHAIIIPLLMIYRRLGMVNTRPGITVAYIVSELSFSIFILVAFMQTLPRELEEAAQIDGSSRSGTFFKIILPISKPGVATIGVFAFVNSWNDLLLALVLTSSPELKTLNLACFNLRGMYVQHYGLITAGLMIMIIPVIVIYIAFQEQMVKGMTAGAVKS